MSEHFAALPIRNSRILCVGGITRAEAEAARDEGCAADGSGYYLFLADETDPKQPIQLLAKFFSPLEAQKLGRLLMEGDA